ncbi:hypothetical protein EVC11_013 [Rhizobium phage RHph_I20]|uniref:Uncharacterized protein n=1 Tax=Rhizobium phage RHph_I20 TaxID=2509730 RepID=A0A7S5UXP9_9CAUD|nr:hypothetical protein EVC11_013 [Rhizobium phage RHph_I20]
MPFLTCPIMGVWLGFWPRLISKRYVITSRDCAPLPPSVRFCPHRSKPSLTPRLLPALPPRLSQITSPAILSPKPLDRPQARLRGCNKPSLPHSEQKDSFQINALSFFRITSLPYSDVMCLSPVHRSNALRSSVSGSPVL